MTEFIKITRFAFDEASGCSQIEFAFANGGTGCVTTDGSGNVTRKYTAGEKKPKAAVQYTDRASDPGERCRLCVHYESPNSCKEVHGWISPSGWCFLFLRSGQRIKA